MYQVGTFCLHSFLVYFFNPHNKQKKFFKNSMKIENILSNFFSDFHEVVPLSGELQRICLHYAFICCFFPTLHFSTTNSVQACYSYNRKSWLTPRVGTSSSCSLELRTLQFYSSGEDSPEILCILSPPLFFNSIEKRSDSSNWQNF